MVEEPRQSDIVDKAFEMLRGSQLLAGPSPQAMEQTLQAMNQAQRKPIRISLVERIRNMNKSRKRLLTVAAAAALILIVIGAWTLLPSDGTGSSSGVAFADVRRQIEQSETMTITVVSEMKGMPKPIAMKMFFKSPGLMRQEMTMDPESFLPKGMTRPASMPASMMAPQQVISIVDMGKQKFLSLVPSQKKAIVVEIKNMPPAELAKTKNGDMLADLKKSVAGEHEELGERTINGQKAKGYRCKNVDMKQVTLDIWVDAKSGKPLMVEQTIPESLGGIKTTMTDFVLNPKLDDSLFDTKPPEGYTVETQVVDYSVKEEDVVKFMGLFAKILGGVFPKSLMPTPDLMTTVMKQADAEKVSEAEMKEFSSLFQKVMIFQIKTMQGGEYVYAGDGVKLGDKATPIMWYKAKDSKTYRVIYGDLHAEDAETAPKRPTSQPATDSR